MTKLTAFLELNCAAEDLAEAKQILDEFPKVNEMSTAQEHVRNAIDHVEHTIWLMAGEPPESRPLSFVSVMRAHLRAHDQKLRAMGIGENVDLLDAMLADMEPFLVKVVTTGEDLRLCRDGDRWNIYGPDITTGPVTWKHVNADLKGYSTLLGAEAALQEIEEGA